MTCREIAVLVASGQLAEAPLIRRLKVRWHWLLCEHCRRFRDQIRALDESLRAALAEAEAEMAPDLAERAARRMTGSSH